MNKKKRIIIAFGLTITVLCAAWVTTINTDNAIIPSPTIAAEAEISLEKIEIIDESTPTGIPTDNIQDVFKDTESEIIQVEILNTDDDNGSSLNTINEDLENKETTETEITPPVVSPNSASSDSNNVSEIYNTWAPYVGNFSIPGVGLSVNCYSSDSQETVDAKNSAAYFYAQGHDIIADHVNQGFNKIKSCNEGTTAYLDGIEYECIDKINGINTGSGLTTANGRDIRDLYPGSLVCYTCNGNWQNVTIVFFRVAGTDNEIPEELGEDSEFYSNDGHAPCRSGTHNWEYEDSFEYWDVVDGWYITYLREHYICSNCGSDWLKTKEIDRKIQEEFFGQFDNEDDNTVEEDINENDMVNNEETPSDESVLDSNSDINANDTNNQEESPSADNSANKSDEAPFKPADEPQTDEKQNNECLWIVGGKTTIRRLLCLCMTGHQTVKRICQVRCIPKMQL